MRTASTQASSRLPLSRVGRGWPEGSGEGAVGNSASDGSALHSLIPLPGPSPDSGEGGRFVALWPLVLALALLALLWLGPLPERARGSFAAHMVMHMGVVALVAPLLALGIRRLFPDALSRLPVGFALVATLLELVAVWGWHAPALHDAARVDPLRTASEQASFLLAGLFVWTAAFGTADTGNPSHRLAGVGALLLTSMHMTLLGALLLFAPRPLYACAAVCSPLAAVTPLQDQAAGGAIMLAVGGIVYLAGGLVLLSGILRHEGRPA